MGSKSKKQVKQRQKVDSWPLARQAFERGDHRSAVKHAKLAYRDQPSPERRQFLEKCQFERAGELLRSGRKSEARQVLGHLCQLGVTDPDLRAKVPWLQAELGLLDCRAMDGAGLPDQTRQRLLRSAVDAAVVGPETAGSSWPELSAGAQLVRSVLEGMGAGANGEATGKLGAIPDDSPLADWKNLALGLDAYYRSDDEAMSGYWSRLEEGRPAGRIARRLAALAGSPRSSRKPDHKTALDRLEPLAFGCKPLTALWEIRDLIARQRWDQAVRALRRNREVLRKFDPLLPGRVVRILYWALVTQGSHQWMAELQRAVDPLPIDPEWNRAWALMWQIQGEIEESESHWRAYLKDLGSVECLTPTERSLAQALVCQHLGLMLARESAADGALDEDEGDWGDEDEEFEDEEDEEFDEDEDDDQDQAWDRWSRGARERAVGCLEAAIKMAPQLLSAHVELAKAHVRWKQTDAAAVAYRALLEQFPEHLEALTWLADHHLQREDPLAARKFALRAHRCKPLDREMVALAVAAHLASACHHALHGQWGEGRTELEAAGRLNPQFDRQTAMRATRAVFEMKAENEPLASELVQDVLDRDAGPAAAWLILAREAVRYQLDSAVVTRFEEQWELALAAHYASPSAAQMCETSTSRRRLPLPSAVLSGWNDRLVRYLEKGIRCRHEPEHLRAICTFLGQEKEESLLDKFLRQSRRDFPRDPFFPYWAAEQEYKKGYQGDRSLACDDYRQALELAEGSANPADVQIAQSCRQRLSLVEDSGFAFRLFERMRRNFRSRGFGLPDLLDLMAQFFGKGTRQRCG